MTEKNATLNLTHEDGSQQTIDLAVHSGTLGPDVVDVGTLTANGYFTYDPGFTSTAACESKITFIDGEKGVLLHRGYPIEQLAQHSDYLETCYLLLNGELPTAAEKEEFVGIMTHHTMVHEQIRTFFNGFRRDAHPMAIMCGVVGALSAFYHDSTDIDDPHHRMVASHRLIAKMPTIAAWAYKYSIGQPFTYPKNDLSYAANFLHMCHAVPTEEYVVNPVVAKALDLIFILHADHEQNCSTATVRVVGSSQANLYSSISAGIAALWGPLHGGANQAVIEMLEKIRRDGGGLQKWIDKAKDKNDSFRLMGFGHRVYKNFDPRATIIKVAADEVLEALGVRDPILDIAKELEQVALNDEYFIERGLYPNVDFYSGIIYRALGIPTDMFTVMFALGRLPGWIGQWKEMTEQSEPIGRPRQVYQGANARPFVLLSDRS